MSELKPPRGGSAKIEPPPRLSNENLAGVLALAKHLGAASHDSVSLTCPVCVQLTTDSAIVVGNDGIGRTIAQSKALRMSDGRQPGDVVDLAHFRKVCPHGGVFRGETCPACGVKIGD